MGLLDRDYTQWKGSKRYKEWARSGHPVLLHCPLCNKESLFWNWRDDVYECLNVECRARGNSIDRLYRPHRVAYTQDSHRDTYTSKYYNENQTPYAKSAEYKSLRRKLPLGKISLIFLIVACVVATIYTGYLLFTHRTNWGVGAIVLAADIGVLIWNISILRKYRVGAGTVISILVVIALLGATVSAFAGVEPFADAKAGVVAWFQKVRRQTPTPQSPPASKYPADIIGHVTIAESLSRKESTFTPSENDAFWVVNVSVRNKTYENPVTGDYVDWRIVSSGEAYWIPELLKLDKPSSVSIPPSETGEALICFSVPCSLTLSDAQICYRGQEPYSYGRLTGGDKVAAYDWDLKTVTTEPKAVVQVENWEIQLDGKSWKGSTAVVKLTITNLGIRRDFGLFGEGEEIIAIDSTDKMVEPWTRKPDFGRGELVVLPPYVKEYYPGESWSGSLKFEMSPYSGKTRLYIEESYHFRRHFLFDLGSPTKD